MKKIFQTFFHQLRHNTLLRLGQSFGQVHFHPLVLRKQWNQFHLRLHYWRHVQFTYPTELQKFHGSVVETTCRLNDPEIQKLNLDAFLALMPYRRFSSWLSIRLHLGGEIQTFQYCWLYNGFGSGLDTNITKNRLNMFSEIPDFFLNISKMFQIAQKYGFIS